MTEEILATARYNPKVDLSLDIWTWEVAVYLFLGGLTAGIMFFAAVAVLGGKEKTWPFVANRLPLWGPIAISVGMGMLFLDLEHKLYVFRFYTAFQPSSPMSWGAWILIFIYPISILQILSTFRVGYPQIAGWLERLPGGSAVLDFAQGHRRAIAAWNIPFAIALGIYTGILLSAFSARPFWNTSILGPLFLVSGLSAAAALSVLVSREAHERHAFARIDVGLIAVELVLIALLIVGLASGARVQLEALGRILGGDFTTLFWFWFVTLGLLVPLLLEWFELQRKRTIPVVAVVAPVLVLFGGYLLRQVTVDLGQVSTWSQYAIQFDPALLDRLH
jgi:formate-dependent nitrite reductase membrane component NrfD